MMELLTDIYSVLVIAFISAIGLFGFLVLFPIMRDVAKGMFRDEFSSRVMAFIITLAALVYPFYIAFYMMTFFIGAITVLNTLFSGFSLIALSRIYRVNKLLFVFSIMLSMLSRYILPYFIQYDYLMIVCRFVNELIFLIGVGEGAVKYLFPLFKASYIKYDGGSYATALTALFIIAWILNATLRWVGVETIPILQQAEDFSTIAFIVGGLMGYVTIISIKRQ
jgi:hypothetical protein